MKNAVQEMEINIDYDDSELITHECTPTPVPHGSGTIPAKHGSGTLPARNSSGAAPDKEVVISASSNKE